MLAAELSSRVRYRAGYLDAGLLRWESSVAGPTEQPAGCTDNQRKRGESPNPLSEGRNIRSLPEEN